jgi:hypothetical protein
MDSLVELRTDGKFHFILNYTSIDTPAKRAYRSNTRSGLITSRAGSGWLSARRLYQAGKAAGRFVKKILRDEEGERKFPL